MRYHLGLPETVMSSRVPIFAFFPCFLAKFNRVPLFPYILRFIVLSFSQFNFSPPVLSCVVYANNVPPMFTGKCNVHHSDALLGRQSDLFAINRYAFWPMRSEHNWTLTLSR